jgi:hypothetical protein
LHGEKENFEEYSLTLSFPILNNYLAEKRQPWPQAMVHAESENEK